MSVEGVSHAELLEVAKGIADIALEQWRHDQKLEPMALTWPAEPVPAEEGKLIFGGVICQLRRVPKQDWTRALQAMVAKTKAFGLVLIEKQDNQIRVLFETHEGARAWLTPLHRHGDLLTPGETTVHDDKECIGILWRPQRGAA